MITCTLVCMCMHVCAYMRVSVYACVCMRVSVCLCVLCMRMHNYNDTIFVSVELCVCKIMYVYVFHTTYSCRQLKVNSQSRRRST